MDKKHSPPRAGSVVVCRCVSSTGDADVIQQVGGHRAELSWCVYLNHMRVWRWAGEAAGVLVRQAGDVGVDLSIWPSSRRGAPTKSRAAVFGVVSWAYRAGCGVYADSKIHTQEPYRRRRQRSALFCVPRAPIINHGAALRLRGRRRLHHRRHPSGARGGGAR